MTRSHKFYRFSRLLTVFASSLDWFTIIFVSFVIGCVSKNDKVLDVKGGVWEPDGLSVLA